MLTDALRDLASALERRVAAAPGADRRARAERLQRHVVDFLLPRARDASAPLIVVILGSTGSGKSSLFNGLVGRAMSPSGVLRPTTRRPLAVVHPDDAGADLLPGMVARGAVSLSVDPEARRGLVLVDAPDFDSVELANRALAVELLEAADLVIFVTSATRYADQVPWSVLDRARQRGVPLLAVLNRLPPDAGDAAAVADDYRQLLERGKLDDAGAFGRLEVVPVSEGDLDPARDALGVAAIAPIRDALDRLTRDEVMRRELARRGLAGALEGLPAAVEEVAREVDDERAAAMALLDAAERAYGERRRALAGELSRGVPAGGGSPSMAGVRRGGAGRSHPGPWHRPPRCRRSLALQPRPARAGHRGSRGGVRRPRRAHRPACRRGGAPDGHHLDRGSLRRGRAGRGGGAVGRVAEARRAADN